MAKRNRNASLETWKVNEVKVSKVNADIKFNTASNNRHLSQWEIYIGKVWWSEKEKFFFCFSNFIRCFTVFIGWSVLNPSLEMQKKERISANQSTAHILFETTYSSWYYFYLIEQSKICEHHSLVFVFHSLKKKLHLLMRIKQHEKENEFN